jgi:UDP-N-acetyl-2-amino-2-deoxyglucuronate dehydrogenase
MLHPIPAITGRRIRISLVGCGRISANHIRAIAAHHERAELTAICDTQPDRLRQAQQHIREAALEFPGAASRPEVFST